MILLLSLLYFFFLIFIFFLLIFFLFLLFNVSSQVRSSFSSKVFQLNQTLCFDRDLQVSQHLWGSLWQRRRCRGEYRSSILSGRFRKSSRNWLHTLPTNPTVPLRRLVYWHQFLWGFYLPMQLVLLEERLWSRPLRLTYRKDLYLAM